MEKELQIFFMPSFDSARESLGYEEYDDYDFEAVLHQQGYEGVIRNFEDGENFEIPEGYIGRLNTKEEYFLLSSSEDIPDKENYIIEDDLPEGRYKLSLKENVIYSLEGNDYEDDDLFGEMEEENGVSDPRVERIFNLITNSAKTRFDYSSFAEKIGDESADNLLFQILVSLAVGESKELAAAKIFSQIIMMGYMLENEALVKFIEQREKDLVLEVLALQMAQTNLDNNVNPNAVFLQTEYFLTNR